MMLLNHCSSRRPPSGLDRVYEQPATSLRYGRRGWERGYLDERPGRVRDMVIEASAPPVDLFEEDRHGRSRATRPVKGTEVDDVATSDVTRRGDGEYNTM